MRIIFVSRVVYIVVCAIRQASGKRQANWNASVCEDKIIHVKDDDT
jgi:hypothetical protein